jgi:hypothetical protein
MPEPTPEQDEDTANEPSQDAETRAALVGFAFIGAIVYFAVFYDRLPNGAWRWVVTVGLAVLAVVLIVAVPHVTAY